MSNPPGHFSPPSDADRDDDDFDPDASPGEPIDDDDDRPLDPDLDDDQLDSADADQRAAREGTLPTDDDEEGA
jgi:hypothetical protein